MLDLAALELALRPRLRLLADHLVKWNYSLSACSVLRQPDQACKNQNSGEPRALRQHISGILASGDTPQAPLSGENMYFAVFKQFLYIPVLQLQA